MRTGARVSEVRRGRRVQGDGTFVPSELVVWSAGVKAPDVLQDIDGLETNRINQLVVQPTLQTTRDPDIFAIGDCAACPREGSRSRCRRERRRRIRWLHMPQMERSLAGKPLEPFHYRDFGSLVSLGKYSTVGSLMGFLIGRSLFIEGYFARLMYRSLYKMHEAALHGGRAVAWRTLVSGISHRPEPSVKLH